MSQDDLMTRCLEYRTRIAELEAANAELVGACAALMAWEDAPLLPTEAIGGAMCLYCDGDFGYRVETGEWRGEHGQDCAWLKGQAAIRKARGHTPNPDAREWDMTDDCPGA